jgi:DNA-binding NtrC family response regulator
MKPLSILMVDDEELVRSLVTMVLERSGHHVVAVADVKGARAALKDHVFDVVVCDMKLGHEEGTDVLCAAALQQPHARRVAMSGGSAALSSGQLLTACTPLMKPFTRDTLIAAVELAMVAAA